MSAVIGWALLSPEYQAGVLMATAFAFLGMAGGRIVSALVDRQINRFPLFYMALEAVCGSLLLLAAMR